MAYLVFGKDEAAKSPKKFFLLDLVKKKIDYFSLRSFYPNYLAHFYHLFLNPPTPDEVTLTAIVDEEQ